SHSWGSCPSHTRARAATPMTDRSAKASRSFPGDASRSFPGDASRSFPGDASRSFPGDASRSFPEDASRSFPEGASRTFPTDALRRRFPALEQAGRFVFFDNAAGAQIPSSVLDAVTEHLRTRNVQRGGPYRRSRAHCLERIARFKRPKRYLFVE